MASLVGYDSADSENEDNSVSAKAKNEVSKPNKDLEAEWESFEKLISGDTGSSLEAGDGGVNVPGGVPCPPALSGNEVGSGVFGQPVQFPVQFPQNPYQHFLVGDPEVVPKSQMIRSSVEDDNSDMDVCSNSSSQDERTSPTTGRQASSKSSSKTGDVDAGVVSESESHNSSTAVRNRHSESTDVDDNDHKKAHLERKSESQSSSSDDSDADEHDMGRQSRSGSSESDKSSVAASKPGAAAAGRVSPSTKTEDLPASNSEKNDAKRLSERRSTSQDRLRSKLLALAEEKVRTSRSRSRECLSRSKRHSPSPSRRHAQDRSDNRHKNRRSSRSTSRDRHRRSRSRDGHRRRRGSRSPAGSHRRRSHRSRSRSHTRRHYRDRRGRRPSNRSRSRDRGEKRRRSRSRSPARPKLNFKEQLKAQLLQVQKQASDEIVQDITVIENKPLVTANEKKSSLPLNNPNPLVAMISSSKDKVTPQQALMQTMAAMHAKAQELTGVAVPSYYNPAAVNPLKYAEQLKKRKLLWSKGKEVEKDKEVGTVTENKAQWTSTSFASDQDGKMAAKFRKLMGIKEEDKMLLEDNIDLSKLTEEQRQRQEELFQQLDREYAFARMTTHTHRGVGLGFQSQGFPDL